ncbi:MAG: PIN domain-containing protein, partial [Candidatus Limnocylindrales bacterium]
EVAAAALELWLTRTMEVFADRIILIDAEITDRWGRLNVPDPVPTIDGLLAATALERNLVLVTRNTRDVESTGVRSLNPFEPSR